MKQAASGSGSQNTTVASEPVKEAPPAPQPPSPSDKPETKAKTLKQLAVAAAGNIGPTDQVAVLVVIQADNQVRLTPLGATLPVAMQGLGLGTVLAGKMLGGKLKG